MSDILMEAPRRTALRERALTQKRCGGMEQQGRECRPAVDRGGWGRERGPFLLLGPTGLPRGETGLLWGQAGQQRVRGGATAGGRGGNGCSWLQGQRPEPSLRSSEAGQSQGPSPRGHVYALWTGHLSEVTQPARTLLELEETEEPRVGG